MTAAVGRQRSSVRSAAVVVLGASALLMILATTPASAQTPAEAPLPLSRFKEDFDPNVKVSTSVPGPLVGATSTGTGNLVTPLVQIPARALADQPVCVETQSRDGIYTATGELLPAWLRQRSGTVRWTYADADKDGKQTEHLPYLTRMGMSDLAVLASIGACGAEGRTTSVAVVVRAGPAEQADSVVLYMLAPEHEIAVSYTTRDGHKRRVECLAPTSRVPSRAFDKLCLLSGPFSPETKIAVEKRLDKRLQKIEYTLLYAAAPSAAR